MAATTAGQSGLLIIDKPQGVTSHDLVAAVRSALHMRKVGHAGTLDPMATGVLVVGFGNATRLLNIIVEHSKTYSATVRFGQRTTTDDADGEIMPGEAGAPVPDLGAVREAVAQSFTGRIEQVPNAYSAIKVNGRRAYDLARAGAEVELKAREVTIRRFDVLDAHTATAADGTPVLDVNVEVECSAGTYIRALARDLGDLFGCGAHLTRLRREAVGAFRADDPRAVHAHVESRAFTNREGVTVTRNRAVLDETGHALLSRALPMIDAVRGALPIVEVGEGEARDLRFGRRIACPAQLPGGVPCAAVVPATRDVVAIAERANARELKPLTVFPAPAGRD